MICNLRHIAISIFALLICGVGFAQDSLVVKSVDQIEALALDANGFFYAADNNNTLHKLDENGKEITNVNVKIYGKISKIDCSNPFEIYTYHQDQNVVVYYDNMLNIRGVTRFNDLYLSGVSAIARTYDNGVWAFDNSNNTIKKISKAGDIEFETNNVNIMLGKELHVFNILEFNNNVYLCDSLIGLIQFDMYGTYVSTHFISDVIDALIDDQNCLINKDNQIMTYHFLSRDLRPIEPKITLTNFMAGSNTKLVSFENNVILVFTAN